MCDHTYIIYGTFLVEAILLTHPRPHWCTASHIKLIIDGLDGLGGLAAKSYVKQLIDNPGMSGSTNMLHPLPPLIVELVGCSVP